MVRVEINESQNIINFVFQKSEKDEYDEVVDMLCRELIPIDTPEEEFEEAFMLSFGDVEVSFLLLK